MKRRRNLRTTAAQDEQGARHERDEKERRRRKVRGELRTQEREKRYSRVVLRLDETEFLFDPVASVRHREFQSARSPAATAATLQEKGTKRRDSISYARQCERDGGTEGRGRTSVVGRKGGSIEEEEERRKERRRE